MIHVSETEHLLGSLMGLKGWYSAEAWDQETCVQRMLCHHVAFKCWVIKTWEQEWLHVFDTAQGAGRSKARAAATATYAKVKACCVAAASLSQKTHSALHAYTNDRGRSSRPHASPHPMVLMMSHDIMWGCDVQTRWNKGNAGCNVGAYVEACRR